jgi:hypothetical protein
MYLIVGIEPVIECDIPEADVEVFVGGVSPGPRRVAVNIDVDHARRNQREIDEPGLLGDLAARCRSDIIVGRIDVTPGLNPDTETAVVDEKQPAPGSIGDESACSDVSRLEPITIERPITTLEEPPDPLEVSGFAVVDRPVRGEQALEGGDSDVGHRLECGRSAAGDLRHYHLPGSGRSMRR